MKLLYDVLNYSPADIKRVVLFATNNALVCDTPDDAMKVAYEIEAQNRYDVSVSSISSARFSDKKHIMEMVYKKQLTQEHLLFIT